MENFKEAAKQIKQAIEQDCGNDPVLLMDKIKELSALTATAAALQANAKKNLLKKELEIIEKYQSADMSPSLLIKKINAECFEEAAWLTYAERLSAGITNTIEGCRSVLSFIKSEMEQIKNV